MNCGPTRCTWAKWRRRPGFIPSLGIQRWRRAGYHKNLVGYFQGDTGTINQIVHLWKFEDDTGRRRHWAAVFANKDFVEGFAGKFRPLVMSQEVKLLTAAPWGPHP